IDFSEVYFIDITRYNETESSAKKYTDSQIKLSEDGIKLGYKQYTDNSVNNIDINDRNILLDSKKRTIDPSPTNNFNYLTYEFSDTNLTKGNFVLSGKIKPLGKEFDKFRAYFRGKDENGKAYGVETIYPSIDENGRFSSAVKSSSIRDEAVHVLLYAGMSGDTAEQGAVLTDIKLQEGNRATAWTPAPEDIDTKIDNIQGSGKNVLQNGSFENGIRGWKYPDGNNYSESIYVVSEGHSGKAIHLDSINKVQNIETPANIPVEPGQRYEISYWYRTSNNFDGTTSNTKIRLARKSNSLISSKPFDTIGGTWKKTSHIGTIPKDVYEMKVTVNSNGKNGWIEYDDIQVVNIDDIENAITESKKYTDSQIKLSEDGIKLGYKQYTDNRVDNIDINDRNLLPNTSDEWEEATFSGWTSGTEVIAIKDIGLSPGDTFTYTMEIDNTRDQKNTDNVRGLISFRTDDGTKLTQRVTKEVKTGKIERVSFTAKIPEKTAILWVHRFSKTEAGKTKTFAARKHKLQRGSYSTDWTPAPEDTDSKIDSIDINDRNLIVANNLKAHPYFTTTPKVEKGGRKVWVKWKTHPGNLIAINVGGFRPEGLYTLSARIEINGKPVTSNRFPSKKIHSSHQDSQNKRFDISDDGRLIATEQFNGNDNGCIFHTYMNDMNEGDIVTFYDFKFQKGNKATDWTPAPEDLVEEATNESKKYTDNQISITEEGIKSKVDKDGVISQINQSSEGVLIDGAKHHITGETKIDNAVITSAMIKDIDASRVTVSANSGKKSVRMTKDGFIGYDNNGRLRLLIGVQDLAGDGKSDPSNVVFYSGNGKKSVSVGTNVDDTFVIGSENSGVNGLVRIPKRLTLESKDVFVMGGTNKSDYGDYWRFGTSTVGGTKHVVMTTDRPNAGALGHSHRFLRKIYTTKADIRKLDVGYGFNNPQEGDFSVRKDSRSGFIMSKVTRYPRTYQSSPNIHITRNGVFGRATSASKYKLNIQNLKQEEALDLGNRLLTLNPSKWWGKDETEDYVSELDGDDDFVDENNVSPYYGMVAEDLRDVGLDPYIEYDEKTGEIEGIQYDRLWTPLIPIIREQRAEIEKLKIEVEKLKIEVEKLMRGGDA
ncbi:carbohydrate binding domain-containing protein, partial [Tetragenococcus halophilus]|uniref:carbohydrate binding domain-containing protein n=1 Tax=Tetragenococcus halophilus TaxID=51669 RepID=UPI00300F8C97